MLNHEICHEVTFRDRNDNDFVCLIDDFKRGIGEAVRKGFYVQMNVLISSGPFKNVNWSQNQFI